MRRATVEMEPGDAARQALTALLEAATYSGKGMRTVGRRAGSRAVVIGAEGSRRAGGAVQALRGVEPPVQNGHTRRILVAATAGGAAGAAVALAIRYGMATRTPANGNGNGKVDGYPEVDAEIRG
jgi:hypothetical protein